MAILSGQIFPDNKLEYLKFWDVLEKHEPYSADIRTPLGCGA